MLQQQTLVKAVCDYRHATASAPRDDGDVTLLFEDEAQACEALGLDEPDGHWRQLANGLVICGPCAVTRDCRLADRHHPTDWEACGCDGWRNDHATPTAVMAGVCEHDVRTCHHCGTIESRQRATPATPTPPASPLVTSRGGDHS